MALKLKCTNCKDVIQSQSVHDFVSCSCKKIAVDGGDEYLRIIGNQEDYIILKN